MEITELLLFTEDRTACLIRLPFGLLFLKAVAQGEEPLVTIFTVRKVSDYFLARINC